MKGDAIYINDTLVDLLPDTVIALTLTKNDFTTLTIRNVSYTNQIKIAKTPNNKRIFNIGPDQGVTATPYGNLPCKIVQGGIETMPFGICTIASIDTNININIYEVDISYFANIAGKKLYQLGYLADGPYNAADVDAARLNSTGIFSPVLNWGNITNAAVNFPYYLPSFFYGEIINKILAFTGLTPSGNILTDAKLTDLIIPFSLPAFVYPSTLTDQYKFTAQGTSSVAVSPASVIINVNSVVQQGAAGIFNAGVGVCEVLIPALGVSGTYLANNFDASIHYNGTGNIGDSFYIKMCLLRGGVETVLVSSPLQTYAVTGGFQTVIALSVQNVLLQDSDQVYLKYFTNTGTPIATIDDVLFNGTHPGTILNNHIFFNYILPDVLMTDLLKDFAVRFGVLFKQKPGQIICKTLQEIMSDAANAIDWSGKRVNKDQDSTVFVSDYAQVNHFRYADTQNDETLGQGDISVANPSLDLEKTIYTSIFSNVKTSLINGINMATIPVYDNTSVSQSDFKNAPPLTVLTKRAKGVLELPYIFNVTPRSDYQVAYFVDSQQPKDTSFAFFVLNQYALLSIALNKTRVPTVSYYLQPTDVAGYDPHKMIFDNGTLYIIDIINSFVRGKITQVEMFRVQ